MRFGKAHAENLRDVCLSSNNSRSGQSQEKFGFGHAARISGKINSYKISWEC